MSGVPVSVIIPTYNRAGRVLNSVQSVLDQTHCELEVIVVDDGSTDETEVILSSIKDERLRYYRKESRTGAADSRNFGVSLASNDIIAFNDSDDIWHPDKLEKQLDYIETHPDDLLVYCAYKVDLAQGAILRIPSANEEKDTLFGDIFYYLLLRPAIGTPTMVIKKQLFEELGGFDVSCRAMEDWEFSLRVAHRGKIGYVDEALLTVEATAKDRLSCDDTLETKMAHYDTKCKVLARYLEDVNRIGQFDLYANEIFNQAVKDGVLEPVKNLMMRYMSGC